MQIGDWGAGIRMKRDATSTRAQQAHTRCRLLGGGQISSQGMEI